MEIDRFILNVLLHSKYLSLSWILWRRKGPHHFRWGLHLLRSKGSAADCSWDKIPEVQFILTNNKYRYFYLYIYRYILFLHFYKLLDKAWSEFHCLRRMYRLHMLSDRGFLSGNLTSICQRIGRNYHFHCCWFSLKFYLPQMWASLDEPLKWKQNSSLFPCAQYFQIKKDILRFSDHCHSHRDFSVFAIFPLSVNKNAKTTWCRQLLPHCKPKGSLLGTDQE